MDYGQEILNGESEWREIRICNTLMPVMFLARTRSSLASADPSQKWEYTWAHFLPGAVSKPREPVPLILVTHSQLSSTFNIHSIEWTIWISFCSLVGVYAALIVSLNSIPRDLLTLPNWQRFSLTSRRHVPWILKPVQNIFGQYFTNHSQSKSELKPG